VTLLVEAKLFVFISSIYRYVSVGDVAYVGDFPDSKTVIAYRYDEDRFEKPLGFDLV